MTERSGEPWSPEEDSELTANYMRGLSLKELACIHRRSQLAIQLRCGKLGFAFAAGDPSPATAYLEHSIKVAEIKDITENVLAPSKDTIKRPDKMETYDVTTKTLIRDRDAESYTNKALIYAIQAEQEHLKKLEELTFESKAVEKIKARHKKNIDALIQILDSRDID
jgi:cobalamin biosynthesis Mg chelatase CobN